MTEPVINNLSDDATLDDLCLSLRQQHYSYISAQQARQYLALDEAELYSGWNEFALSWHNLELDPYMADGGSYRRRRHAIFSTLPATGEWFPEPHQAHYQSLNYNPLNGGILRYYQPILDGVWQSRIFGALLSFACRLFSQLSPGTPWFIEAHQFRIETNARQQGLPTPEGIHRDGVDYIMMVLVDRQDVKAGVSQIFDHNRKLVNEFTLSQAMSMAIVYDREIFHSVTPIQPLDSEKPGYRDVLVLTFKDRNRHEKEFGAE